MAGFFMYFVELYAYIDRKKGDIKMVERIKNKNGFTIIEIMVVIALIGILAAVLVPKFGGIKDTAKNAGMLTNAKMVEAYVASEIDNWTTTTALHDTNDDMKDAIDAYFTANLLKNPYIGTEAETNVVVEGDASQTYSEGDNVGVVYVTIDNTDTLEVRINGFDANKNEIKSTQRTVTQ